MGKGGLPTVYVVNLMPSKEPNQNHGSEVPGQLVDPGRAFLYPDFFPNIVSRQSRPEKAIATT